jgi:transposase
MMEPPEDARTIDAELKEDGVPVVLSQKQVADVLGRSDRTVRRYVAAERLQPVQAGARPSRFFMRIGVARFLADGP